MNDRDRSIHLNPVQVVAGALASVTAAVLASFFGVAGTVIGAGVMSAAASVGKDVYSYWIRSTHRAIRETIPSTLREQAPPLRTLVGAGARVSRGSPGGTSGDGARSDPDTNEVPALGSALDVPPPGPLGPPPTSLGRPPAPPGPASAAGTATRRDLRSRIEGLWPAALSMARSLRWRNIAFATVVVFGLSMGAVTAVEALAKKPLSSIVGGSTPAGSTTSLGGLVGGGQSSKNTPTPPPSEPTTTNPQTTTPNSSATTTTPPSTGSIPPGQSTTTTTPSSTTPSTPPGTKGITPGSTGSSSGASSGASSGTAASGTDSGSSASGASATGTPTAGG